MQSSDQVAHWASISTQESIIQHKYCICISPCELNALFFLQDHCSELAAREREAGGVERRPVHMHVPGCWCYRRARWRACGCQRRRTRCARGTASAARSSCAVRSPRGPPPTRRPGGSRSGPASSCARTGGAARAAAPVPACSNHLVSDV